MDYGKIIRFAQSLDVTPEAAERIYDVLLDEFGLERPLETPREKKGVLITFDGHSGAGKDTHIGMLGDYMNAAPGYNKLNMINLVQKREDPFRQVPKFLWANREEFEGKDPSFMLQTAGRRYFVHSKLCPLLEHPNNIVLQNRSYLSNVAYCAYDEVEIPGMLELCGFDPNADLPFVLECGNDAAFERVRKRAPEKGGVIYPNELPEYTSRVRGSFHVLSRLVGGLLFIDTNCAPHTVAQEIRGHVDRFFEVKQ